MSAPNLAYRNFPGWGVFLDTKRKRGVNKNTYSSWQEASVAAIGLEIASVTEYRRRYREDPRLPSAPDEVYTGFPGWKKFLNTGQYHPTWLEASVAAIGLGIRSQLAYKRRYKEDPRLPSNPDRSYQDFPNWSRFLGK